MHMDHHNQPAWWASRLAMLNLLLIVLAGLLGVLAIASGQIAAPQINLQVGPYHFVSRTTSTPNCHPLSAGCTAGRPNVARTGAYYSIWVVSVTEVPVAGGVIEQLNTERLLMLPVTR